MTNYSIDGIPGHQHVRRAIEVAIAGGHSIHFIGSYWGEVELLADFTADLFWKRHNLFSYSTSSSPCPCGNYDNPERECTCSLEMIRDEQLRIPPDADIYIEVVPLMNAPDKIISFLKNPRIEPWEKVMKRIGEMTQLDDLGLDDTSYNLLNAAISQLPLTWAQVQRIMNVARTIANLAHQPKIHFAHLAEAIQYRPRLRHATTVKSIQDIVLEIMDRLEMVTDKLEKASERNE